MKVEGSGLRSAVLSVKYLEEEEAVYIIEVFLFPSKQKCDKTQEPSGPSFLSPQLISS